MILHCIQYYARRIEYNVFHTNVIVWSALFARCLYCGRDNIRLPECLAYTKQYGGHFLMYTIQYRTYDHTIQRYVPYTLQYAMIYVQHDSCHSLLQVHDIRSGLTVWHA